MYLDPHDGKEPMFKAAVRLLHNHGESLDPLQVLEVWSPPLFSIFSHIAYFTLISFKIYLLWYCLCPAQCDETLNNDS